MSEPHPSALAPARRPALRSSGAVVNDVQSQLNATRVHRVLRPRSEEDVQRILGQAAGQGRAVSVAGGRHSMGGQQFGRGTLHCDMTGLAAVLDLDRERGLVTAGAGIRWPRLIRELHRLQPGDRRPWVIREKQTGVDEVTLGGSLSANAHGRSLAAPPMVGDIESFAMIDAAGRRRRCSRTENPELFALAIGGYGLLGVITRVTLRLVRRFKVRRRVEVMPVRDLLVTWEDRVRRGFAYGDCQYCTALTGAAEDHPGIVSCYEPIDPDTPVPEDQKQLSGGDWAGLYRLARSDKQRAFDSYCRHYRQTDGQVYWSDTHQLAGSFAGHRRAVDPRVGTEMITEVYVRHDDLVPFLARVREDFEAHGVDMTYGTIRFIEQDRETFLPWARQRSVCIVCNLHVRRGRHGLEKARADFGRILDRVLEVGGSFYLAYHRWATRRHLEACYPQLRDFFRRKREHDPEERFQSEWYRHSARLLEP